MSENSYIKFHGNTIGILSVPVFKHEGHCPFVRFNHLTYLDKNHKLKDITLLQFQYILNKIKNSLKAQSFDSFVVDFSGTFFEIKYDTPNSNLYNFVKSVTDLSFKLLTDWRKKDVKVTFDCKIYKSKK